MPDPYYHPRLTASLSGRGANGGGIWHVHTLSSPCPYAYGHTGGADHHLDGKSYEDLPAYNTRVRLHCTAVASRAVRQILYLRVSKSARDDTRKRARTRNGTHSRREHVGVRMHAQVLACICPCTVHLHMLVWHDTHILERLGSGTVLGMECVGDDDA